MTNYLKAFVLLLAVFTINACTSVTPYFSKTGVTVTEPLPDNCDVTVFSTRPPVKYEELGVLDLDVFIGFSRPDYLRRAGKFKEKFSSEICRAGGNGILLWESVGDLYLKATVIKLSQ